MKIQLIRSETSRMSLSKISRTLCFSVYDQMTEHEPSGGNIKKNCHKNFLHTEKFRSFLYRR